MLDFVTLQVRPTGERVFDRVRDERYRHLVGTEVELPLTGRRIPVVADAGAGTERGCAGCRA
jgi:valyl-tRNA synthetase